MDWLTDLFRRIEDGTIPTGSTIEVNLTTQDEEFTQIGNSYFRNGKVATDEEVEIWNRENSQRKD